MYSSLILLFLLIVAFCLILLNIWLFWWASHSIFPFLMGGGPFVPIPTRHIDTVMELADIHSADTVIDLGSGDGRLLIAAARASAHEAIGYEIHPGLVARSVRRIKKESLENKIRIHRQSFWHADLSSANVVLIYQISYAMKRLEKKLLDELPVGARVVSHGFQFPNWKMEKVIGNTRVYIKK